MSARLAWLAALTASAVLVVGCAGTPAPTAPAASAPGGSPGSSGGPGGPSVAPSVAPSAVPSVVPSAAPAQVLLKVTTEGGFINPAATLNALPIVEVLGDGRILTPGAVDAIAPAPLLPTLQVRDTGPAGAAAILAAIQAAGLDKPATAGPGIPGDSGTDIFSVTIDGATTVTRISGNGPGVGGPGVGGPGVGGPGGPGAGGSADPATAAAFDLLTRLTDLTVAWGGSAPAATSWTPSGYRVFVIPGAPTSDPATPQQPVAWPLPTALAAFGTPAVPDRGVAGLRQGAVIGADAATLQPVLAKATVETPFTSGGAAYTLVVRPLLPDETGN